MKCFSQVDSSRNSDFKLPRSRQLKQHLSFISGLQVYDDIFAEAGIGIKNHGVVGPHPLTSIYGLTSEFKLNEFSKDFIWGAKAGMWMGGGLNLGLNLINYTNFEKNTVKFRPEVGIGLNSFRVVYGYNLTIVNKDFQGVNTHNFALNIILNLKKLK